MTEEGKNGKNVDVEDEERDEEPKPDAEKGLREQLLRLAAEFDNYKKRTRAETENANMMGRASMAKDLLPIIDEFELALIAAGRSDDKVLTKGIEMLYSNLIDVMKRNGLTTVPTEGKFDPYRHEIVMVKEDGTKKDGAILEVMKKGYMFKDMMLRPASVVVAKGKEAEQKTDGDDK
ncbi:MAG: nucleotide exchange factor GrpE [Candidatus Micrarchaeaceae archaeon]